MLITSSEIISKSWNIYKTNWRKFVIYIVFLVIPTFILTFVKGISLASDAMLPKYSTTSSIIILLLTLVMVVFNLWTTVAVIEKTANLINGTEITWQHTYTTTTKLLWRLIYTSLLVGLVVIGGSILLVIPGIIFLGWYAFTNYILVIENKGGLESMRASRALVSGRWFAMVWRMLLPILAFMLFSIISQSIFDQIIGWFISDDLTFNLITGGLATIVNSILAPLYTLAMVVLYYSAKDTPVAMSTASHLEPPVKA